MTGVNYRATAFMTAQNLFRAARLQMASGGGIAGFCNAFGQGATARFVGKLLVARQLECDQRVHRAGLAQFGVLDRCVEKALRIVHLDVRVFRQQPHCRRVS